VARWSTCVAVCRFHTAEEFGGPTLRLTPHPLSLSPSEGERETAVEWHAKSLPLLLELAWLYYGSGIKQPHFPERGIHSASLVALVTPGGINSAFRMASGALSAFHP
jgi:hypothetical protein